MHMTEFFRKKIRVHIFIGSRTNGIIKLLFSSVILQVRSNARQSTWPYYMPGRYTFDSTT